MDLLQPIILDDDLGIDLVAFAALSLGLVYVGTCSDEVCGAIIQVFIYFLLFIACVFRCCSFLLPPFFFIDGEKKKLLAITSIRVKG